MVNGDETASIGRFRTIAEWHKAIAKEIQFRHHLSGKSRFLGMRWANDSLNEMIVVMGYNDGEYCEFGIPPTAIESLRREPSE